MHPFLCAWIRLSLSIDMQNLGIYFVYFAIFPSGSQESYEDGHTAGVVKP